MEGEGYKKISLITFALVAVLTPFPLKRPGGWGGLSASFVWQKAQPFESFKQNPKMVRWSTEHQVLYYSRAILVRRVSPLSFPFPMINCKSLSWGRKIKHNISLFCNLSYFLTSRVCNIQLILSPPLHLGLLEAQTQELRRNETKDQTDYTSLSS